MESTPALPLPTSDEKIMAIIMHVMPLFGLVLIGPFIIWLIKKDESPYLRTQGANLLNFHLSTLLYAFIGVVLTLVLVGYLLLWLLGIYYFILSIVGLVKVVDGKTYRFPLSIGFLS
ncbi:membrane protein [Verrucomicrobiota bacterium]|nr:membrane protein [Verrucomicrobiota bacterium]